MAVTAPTTPDTAPQIKVDDKAVTAGLGAQAYLARLEVLHDEAAETAHLSNLLSRTPMAAGAIGLAGLLTIALSLRSMPSPPLALWAAWMVIAVGITARIYGRAIASPFDRDNLKGFARDLSAILMFTGTIWGSGVTSALPPDASIAVSIFYVAGTSAAVAAALRARDVSFCFLVPAMVVGALCALIRSLDGILAADILGGGVVAAAAAVLIERYTSFGFTGRRQH
jgi:hypothetical protein